MNWHAKRARFRHTAAIGDYILFSAGGLAIAIIVVALCRWWWSTK